MSERSKLLYAPILFLALAIECRGQAYGLPDRGEPGDAMIQRHLAREAERIQNHVSNDIKSADDWAKLRPRYREELLYMLGIKTLSARDALHATITGKVEGNGFIVENLHYQSSPGLYVTANLYRPASTGRGERLPAVLYVCGHSGMGRNGNKTAFQSHGIWLAKHGYVCLLVDTLQLGEIVAVHHGTYREGRWWWHSRGYTPAGVECWNGIRGLDYLASRLDVDPERLGVTGISGGGAVTFWVAAADERVKVAVPVSGMADLTAYVANRCVNGHCDCMFMYNTFEWPWTRIGALIAPRPLLFINSNNDAIFPMDANERVINHLERVYSMFGLGDRVDSLVSIGGHDYRKDIREASFRFINSYLKVDPKPVNDTEVDLIGGSTKNPEYPISPERLRVFPTDADLPADQKNTRIDQFFVPKANPELPENGQYVPWKAGLVKELKRLAFRPFPDRIPPASTFESTNKTEHWLETEAGIIVPSRHVNRTDENSTPSRVVMIISGGETGKIDTRLEPLLRKRDLVYRLEPRGVGSTRWTTKNPPNYVARAHVLLGKTVDEGRLRDVISAARYLRARHQLPVTVAGTSAQGVIGAYAALLEPEIEEVIAISPPSTHMDPNAPQFLNVLRILDIPEALGTLAPKPLHLKDAHRIEARIKNIYAKAGATDKLNVAD